MKSILLSLSLPLLFFNLFSDSKDFVKFSDDFNFPKKQESLLNKGYIYVKAGATSGVLNTEASTLLGLGYRSKLLNFEPLKNDQDSYYKFFPAYSFDLNIGASAKIYTSYAAALELYLPKFSTLFYMTPNSGKSFFVGYGFALAIMTPLIYYYENQETNQKETYFNDDSFVGISTSLIAGYTPTLHKKYLNSVELEFNLPTETIIKNFDKFEKNWTINLTYCLGF